MHRRMILLPIPVCGTSGHSLSLTDHWEETTCKKCLVYQRPVILTDRSLLSEQLERSIKLLENILESEVRAPSLTTKQLKEARAIVTFHRGVT